MGSPSGTTRTTPTVDGSDRKFYVKAAENGNEEALERFDAALAAQSKPTPPPADPPVSRGEELARQYAPVLVLPDGGYDLPGDPQEFIDNSRLRTDRSFFPDSEQGNNINGDSSDDFNAADVGASGSSGQFLDLDNEVRGTLGSESAPFFYQVDNPDQPTKVTYWFFYPYNDGPGPQNHEGDFERITIEFDPNTGEPVEAIYSAHGNKHTKPTPYGDLETYRDPATGEATGKPLVYVASGSHASYPTAGTHPSDAPELLRDLVGSSVDDRTVGGLDGSEHAVEIFSFQKMIDAAPAFTSGNS
jgi:hypothetical protein